MLRKVVPLITDQIRQQVDSLQDTESHPKNPRTRKGHQ
jgi:hypothetical protein